MDSISEGKIRPVLVPRRLTEADLTAVQTLAQLCFDDGWSAADFRYFIQNACGYCEGVFAKGETSASELRGYFLGLVVAGTLDIISVAVHPDLRRQAVAQALVQRALASPGVENSTLEVAVTNVAAIALYKKMGFRVRSVRKNYYQGKIDAYLMRWERTQSAT